MQREVLQLTASITSDLLGRDISEDLVKLVAQTQDEIIIDTMENLEVGVSLPRLGRIVLDERKNITIGIAKHYHDKGLSGQEIKDKIKDCHNLINSRTFVIIDSFGHSKNSTRRS